MLKFAQVRLSKGGNTYSYFTNIYDLQKNQRVIVDALGELQIGWFVQYSDDEHIKKRATKWILKALSRLVLENNLKCELEEEGIDINMSKNVSAVKKRMQGKVKKYSIDPGYQINWDGFTFK